jgi:hypothetical protein
MSPNEIPNNLLAKACCVLSQKFCFTSEAFILKIASSPFVFQREIAVINMILGYTVFISLRSTLMELPFSP